MAVEGGEIRAVGPTVAEWQHLPAIDATGMTLLPGLIESHAHVTEAGDWRQALRFGVTTLLDMCTPVCRQRPFSPSATLHDPT